MTNNQTRAFGLVRVSTQLQTEEHGGTGIQFQSEKLTQYANLNDFNLVKTISDVASGGLETRQGIEELKSHIENNEVDIVLIWNVSRAFRSMIYFAEFYKYLKEYKVELISVSEGIRSSRKEGEMMFGIMASIAGYEKQLINERMYSGRTTKVMNQERGFGGKVPFGYKRNNDGDVKIDNDNADIVKYIFKKYNQLLKSPKFNKNTRTRRLIKLMNNRGFQFHNKRFRGCDIRHILNSTFYMGVMTYGEIKTNHKYPTLVSKRLFNQVSIS
jgi:site-specific DNA recombinase